jgi:hypothetical protein
MPVVIRYSLSARKRLQADRGDNSRGEEPVHRITAFLGRVRGKNLLKEGKKWNTLA